MTSETATTTTAAITATTATTGAAAAAATAAAAAATMECQQASNLQGCLVPARLPAGVQQIAEAHQTVRQYLAG